MYEHLSVTRKLFIRCLFITFLVFLPSLFLSVNANATSSFDTKYIQSQPVLKKKEVNSNELTPKYKEVKPSLLGYTSGTWHVDCGASGTNLIGIGAPNYMSYVYFSCFMPGIKKLTPLWTVHKLDPKYFAVASSERPEFSQWIHFNENTTGNGRTFAGMDRGHLVPRSDFGRYKDTAMSTFTVLNRAPQNRDLNQNGWRAVESVFREYARKKNKPFIVITGITPGTNSTGESMDTGKKYREKNTMIPDSFWKVLYDPTQKSAIYVKGKNESRKAGSTGMASLGISAPDTISQTDLKNMNIHLEHANSPALLIDFYTWLVGKPLAAASENEIVAAFHKVTKVDSPAVCDGSAVVSLSLRRTQVQNPQNQYETIPAMYLVEGTYKETASGCSKGCGITIKKNAEDAIDFEGVGMNETGSSYDTFITDYKSKLLKSLDSGIPNFTRVCGDKDDSTWTKCINFISGIKLPYNKGVNIRDFNDRAELTFDCHYLD